VIPVALTILSSAAPKKWPHNRAFIRAHSCFNAFTLGIRVTTSPDYVARLLLLGLILAINAFFAASEVALLSVRDSRLRHLAEEGNAGAKIALALLAQPEKLLSVTQIGVTLASLGLGWAGEDTLFALLMSLFHPILTAATAAILRAVCFVAAFVVMTYCHVVIGEVVPKNLAIDKADRLAVVVAPALMLFYRLTSVFVAVIEGSARGLTRLLGVKASHRGGGHSAEELKLVVSSSRFAGNLPKLQEDMIHRVLDLDDLYVREIMKPRREIVSVSSGASLDEVLKTMVESQHSRLPVWEEKPEQIIGAVFFKDMLRIWHERRTALRAARTPPPFHLINLMRKPLIVPETKPLMQMLEEFRQRHLHMALVVDEFGTVTGLLTVEDVLEQIVGEIEDEFDEKLPAAHPLADWKDLDGATSIRDLASIHGIELPANGGFETIAGYMLFKLGHIPQAGESVEFDGRRFTVTNMDRNRIATVRIEPHQAAESHDATDKEGAQVAGH
jgi:putative hemolysin